MARHGAETKHFQRGRPMGGGKRTLEQKEADMILVTDLFIRGYSYRQIASRLNDDLEERGLDYRVSHTTIAKDLNKLLVEWKKERFNDIDAYISAELKKLERIESELWEAWELSKGAKRKTKIKGGEITDSGARGGQLNERTLETTTGNPKYLDLILNVQQRRAKLLGYDAPIKMDIHKTSDPRHVEEQEYHFEDIPEEEMAVMVERMLRATSKRVNEEKQNSNISE